MDEFDDSGDGSSSLDFISSLANNATQAYEQSAALNANPLNTALVYGGTAQTSQGIVSGAASPLATPTMTSTSWILLILAGGAILFFVTRK